MAGRTGFSGYVAGHFWAFFIVCAAFIIGILVGALTVGRLGADMKNEVLTQLTGAIEVAASGEEGFFMALAGNVKGVLLIWFLGMTVLGALPLIFYCGMRGYAVGFTVGFMSKHFGVLGALIGAAGILPHGILIIPAMLFLAVQGVLFSTRIITARGTRVKDSIGTYCLWAVFALVLALLASAVEGFVTPSLVRLCAALIAKN